MNYTFAKYKKRKSSLITILKKDNWNLKVYGIRLNHLPDEKVISFLFDQLPRPALTKSRYGMGFLIIHKGVVANWFLLNWWGYEDIVHQKLFSSPVENFNDVKPVEDKTILACVHELDIYNFESEAWKDFVLSNENPDFERYLKTGYE